MTKRIMVNLRQRVSTADIRRETRDGREVIIVPSATLPDNIVMNGIRYPAEEIENSYYGFEGSPAPLGHPAVNGKYVSARSVDGMIRGFIGAGNENVRRENGRVFMDKVIDIARAKESEGGRRILEAIEKREPIHTSTGLFCEVEAIADAEDGATHVAKYLHPDHDAFILDGVGAATPEQGVGIFVNCAVDAKGNEIDLFVSDLEGMKNSGAAAPDERGRSILSQLVALLKGNGAEESKEVNDMSGDNQQAEQIQALTKGLDDLGKTVATIAEGVTALTTNMQAMQDAQKAQEEAELTELRSQIVTAGLLDEAEAGELTVNAARALAKRAKPGKAASLKTAGDEKPEPDGFEGYDMNKAIEEGMSNGSA